MAKKKGHKGKFAHKHTAASATAAAKTFKKHNDEDIDLDAINTATVASVSMVGQPVMVKLCRLCESKDGPFLNIFDGDKVLAKKINQLLPLVIDEYDKLPHKICFRCSAKVEELHEFAQRCIRTQESLKKKIGESKSAIARKNWEEKLKESKISNDDYCETLIKQAMEKIIGPSVHDEPLPRREPTPPAPTPPPTQKRLFRERAESPRALPELEPQPPQRKSFKEQAESPPKNDDIAELKQPKIMLDRVKKTENVILTRGTRSRTSDQKQQAPEEANKYDSSDKEDTEVKTDSDCFLVGMVIKEKDRPVKVTKNTKKHEPVIQDEVPEVKEPKVPEKKDTKVEMKKDGGKEKVNGTAEKKTLSVRKILPEKRIVAEKKIIPEQAPVEPPSKPAEQVSEFDIMKNVCTIKVGGAGYLFQCKLCKRNFLKKEVVMGHNCARVGNVVKANSSKPEPPKLLSVKPDIPKPPAPRIPSKPTPTDQEIIQAFKNKTAQSLSINSFSMESSCAAKPEPSYAAKPEPSYAAKPEPSYAAKPKPGPASRKKIVSANSSPSHSSPTLLMQQLQKPSVPPVLPPTPTVQPSAPSVQLPGCKNRYKLVPGLNNTFTLIEDNSAAPETGNNLKRKLEEPPRIQPETRTPNTYGNKKNVQVTLRNKVEVIQEEDRTPKQPTHSRVPQNIPQLNHSYTNITPDNHNFGHTQIYQSQPQMQMQHRMDNQPYPVGLFQTIPRGPVAGPPPLASFSTPAMKKQSYSVVQTGNPNKLLISTKQNAPPPPAPPPPPGPKTKKGKKAKAAVETVVPEAPKQPFSVTIEDSAPPKDPNEGFFTFINVDPLLQPSYVLPTTSIIQESQITTSTPASEQAAAISASKKGDCEVYTCELCQMEFSREKKLLTHLQSHYSKPEDILDNDERYKSVPKKRTRKS